jgi:hypothetical protein
MQAALRLLFIVIGSCVYAGLAVLGWDGFRPFFSHPALGALVVVLFALSAVAFFAGGSLSPGIREARGNRWVIAVFIMIGLLNAYVPRTPIAGICGRSMEVRFAGSVLCSSPPMVRCGSGQYMC